ncbi:hypothetical protein [Noviherbaspirillum saxi]|uniref:hypothetical protein n=1 Tax=Noviherbaspirillum saxi TaxID=2320863 RepID=UPI0011C3848D|nr:hypothetical protein [Noviherbaspirillum saxi]
MKSIPTLFSYLPAIIVVALFSLIILFLPDVQNTLDVSEQSVSTEKQPVRVAPGTEGTEELTS